MRIYLILITLFCFQLLFAQDVKQQINSIKQNEAYMNAESTDESWDEAFRIALEELVGDANLKFSADIPYDAAKKVTKFYEIKRGESVRVFVYALVKDLSDIASSYPYSEQTNDPIKPQTPTSSNNQNNSTQSEQPNTPSQQASPSVPVSTIIHDNSQLTSVSEIFSRMNTMSEIKSLLREYKPMGKIREYNWVTSVNIPIDAHIVIFRDETIVAVLLGEKKGKRINILNSKEDSINNYSKCRAIWYK